MGLRVKRKIALTVMTLLIALSFTGCGTGKGQAAGSSTKKTSISKETYKQIDELFTSTYGQDSFSGYVYIAKNDSVIFEKSYGMADFDQKISNTKQTKFQVASLTKQFTALSVMQLQEKGLLNVKDTIDKYLPAFPNGNKITIHHLLSNTSGLPEHSQDFDITQFSPFNTKEPKDVEKMNIQFLFEPGQSFQYSNTGYILLGYIVEKVSGKTLDQYFKENIFTPLDMQNSAFRDKNLMIDNMATGYVTKNKDKVENSWYDIYVGPVRGSSGLCTTVEDLIKWDKGLLDYKLITKESTGQMYTPNLNGYGYGWYIAEDANKNKLYQHSGVSGGYRSYIQRKPEDGTTIIILSNFGDAPLEDMALILSGYLSK